MKMFLLAATTLATTAFAQQDWVQISTTTKNKFEVRAGSFERSVTTRTGEPIALFIVRISPQGGGRIEFEKNYVKLSDCRTGYGKLVATDLNGRAMYENDFIFGGGTPASTIAQTLCELAEVTKPSDIAPADVTPSVPIAPAGPAQRF